MSETINPAVMQHLVEAVQHEVDALSSSLPKAFIVQRLNRCLEDMRAQVGYDLSRLVTSQPTTCETDYLANSAEAKLAEKIEILKQGEGDG